jgi:hypothetical protein
MNRRADDALIEKLKSLSPAQITEVIDFVDFLRMKNDERALTQAASKAAEPSLSAVWDNEEDAAYDRL